MIRVFTAFTSQIDDPELAVSEILGQLELEGKLLGNSVGILTCFGDFLESGVTAALCERLPFDVVGCTTVANAANGEMGEFSLTLMVLTSDDITFSAGLTEPLSQPDKELLRAAYDSAAAGKDEGPALILSFAPQLMNIVSDFYSDAMNDISGGVPNFGGIASDHATDFSLARVIHNGLPYADRLAFILVYGDIDPAFYITAIPDENIFPEKCVVTSSRENHLVSVNNMPIFGYLQSMGLGMGAGEDGVDDSLGAFCWMMNLGDGTEPIARVMFYFTPDKNFAVCGGLIPEGSTLSLTAITAEKILASARQLVEKAVSAPKKPRVALMHSCLGRYFAQNFNPTAELDAVLNIMSGRDIPYSLSYTGGEFCPVYSAGGGAVNRSHNVTFVICTF